MHSAPMINGTTLWASQLAALNAQGPVQANGVTSAAGSANNVTSAAAGSANNLFAELISALTSGVVTVNGSSATSATSVAGASAAAAAPSATSAAGSTTATGATTAANTNAAASATTSADVASLKTLFNKLQADLVAINGGSVRNSLHLLA